MRDEKEQHKTKGWIFVAVLLLQFSPSFSWATAHDPRSSMSAKKTPSLIELPGGAFEADTAGAKTGPREQAMQRGRNRDHKVLKRKVYFPVRGVWYVWIKAQAEGIWPAVLGYSLDGLQPLQSSRKEILIQPQGKPAWHSFSRFPNFRIEVNVDQPGEHELAFSQVQGSPKIEKVLLTLYFSATLKGDSLDMSGDPGQGWAEAPLKGWEADGCDLGRPAPALKPEGRTFYVDPDGGDDASDGRSPSKAFQSLGKVNTLALAGGDAILLKRGSRFQEGLEPQGSGTEKRWIHLGAYGQGASPLVNGGPKPGLHLKDQSYWSIQDLSFCSDPEYRQDALWLEVTEKAPRPKGIRLSRCRAFDSGRHGVNIGGYAGYDGVVVEDCLSFCNGGDGIVVHGATAKSCRNTVIRHCTAYSNPGMAGIWIEGGENGLIDGCLAYNNACVNIWAWNAVNITMRRCEAFRGRPQRDAAGFDIDWGSQACTLEYCYAHANEGDAFLLMGSGNGDYLGHSMQSNHGLMRWCVSEGHVDVGETFNHGKVYNNVMLGRGKGAAVIFLFGWPNMADGAKGRDGGWPEDTHFRNNVVVALDGAAAMHIDDYGTRQGNSWDYNLFWKGRSKQALILWGGRKNGPKFWEGDPKTGSFPPKAYAGLKAFQKGTGQEAHGLEADPGFEGAGPGAYGRLPLSSCRLKASSPAKGAGTPMVLDETWLAARRVHLSDTGAEAYGIPMDPDPVDEDYWGEKLDRARASIGAQGF
jgi:hypothetical protein